MGNSGKRHKDGNNPTIDLNEPTPTVKTLTQKVNDTKKKEINYNNKTKINNNNETKICFFKMWSSRA